MYSENIDINQTHIRLTTDIKSNDLRLLIYKIHNSLNSFINSNRDFLLSLDNLDLKVDKQEDIIGLMADSSKKADVGPMACVAGSISELCLNRLIQLGSRYSIVENGGDIAILNNKTVLCGIYSNNKVIENNIAFRIKPRRVPLGICTSSGKIGHSISFGSSDSVTVVGNSSSLADGLATRIANEVNGDNSNEAISNALEVCEDYREYFNGVLIICGDNVGTIGKLPKLVKTSEFRLDKI
ncbi:MAG: UPF0280 family protein [Methanobrevibacter sp.]|uniref:UPF0280 family protein n=1 Tax=Methanobrevibacter sp. TaxID=66852 RepID=UPI0026E0E319|nr:UPF0280 family protein [Methanobrevibacter sp.]MDO5848721.1 UPF0280 family protein [Methanobrevibacter sp.]